MDTSIQWQDGLHFTGETPSGFTLSLDGGPDVGGQDKGARPLEFMAFSLMGCTGMDVISILNKMRQEVTDFKINFHADWADGHPYVWTKVELEYLVYGRNLKPALVEKAINLSAERYCPAQAMLSKAVEITTSYQIFEIELE